MFKFLAKLFGKGPTHIPNLAPTPAKDPEPRQEKREPRRDNPSWIHCPYDMGGMGVIVPNATRLMQYRDCSCWVIEREIGTAVIPCMLHEAEIKKILDMRPILSKTQD